MAVARYDRMVSRLEQEARIAPGRYRAKVALLALLGFAVLGGAFLLALGLSAGLVIALLAVSPLLLLKLAKIVWIPIGFGWMILRALWIRFEAPQGHVLRPDEAPALHAEVERLRLATGAPRLDAIVIDGDINAAAASVPRAFGLLGYRHYLVLGLPLMQALDRDQLAGVIAHEFGHFGGGHGRFSGWIHHVRSSWTRVLMTLASEKALLTGVFMRFFRWYAPYFDAYSFVLARGNEYQADAIAARTVGAPALGQALIRTGLCAERLHRDYWPALQRRVADTPSPPEGLQSDIARVMRSTHDADAGRLAKSLARRPDYEDTHPSLAQRLEALGVAPDLQSEPRTSAAESLLGPLLPTLETQFDREWRDAVAEGWRVQHERLNEGRQRLAALEASAAALSDDERVERALLLDLVGDPAEALPAFRDAIAVAPDDVRLNLRLGALLLERGDPAGADLLWRAIALDREATPAACEALHAHYRETDDRAGIARTEAEINGYFGRLARAADARSEVDAPLAALAPHGLDAPTVARLRTELAAAKVGVAWLVRRRIEEDPPEAPPHFLLLVNLRGFVVDETAALERVRDAVDALPGSFVVFGSSGHRIMAGRVRKVARGPVFG